MKTIMVTRQVLIFMACALIIVTLSGCWATQEWITLSHLEKHLPALDRGATLQDVEHAFNSKAEHEFTIERDGKSCVCVSLLAPPCWCDAILIDGKLEKIVETPSRKAEDVRIDGQNVSRLLPWRPEEEAEKVLDTKDLLGCDLIVSVHRRYPYLRNSNLAGGEFILGPIMFLSEFEKLPELRRMEALAQRFSPFKISMGMSENEVEAIFDKPFRTVKGDNNELIAVFGCDSAASGMFPEASPWVAVIFRDGRVNRIFSHRFFNKEMYLPADLHVAQMDIRRE